MKKDDMKKFGMILVGIGEIYGKEISESLSDIYWEVLEKYEFEDVNTAFLDHIKNPDFGQFFPRPSDIIRAIEGTGEAKALRAWTKVKIATEKVGSYNSVVFDDPLIHSVILEMGGWIQVCLISNKELPFKESEFKKRYMGLVSKPPSSHPSSCVGIFEGDNLMHGYKTESTIWIGDKKKSEMVRLTGTTGKSCFSIGKFLENFTKKELK